MLIPAPASVAPNRPMNPGLSWLVTYSMCGAKSASTLMPLISTMRGRDPANSVPETDARQPVGRYRHPHQGLVFARPVVHGFGHVDAVIARGDRRIDHVDAFH